LCDNAAETGVIWWGGIEKYINIERYNIERDNSEKAG
jgi:hypothetical protein